MFSINESICNPISGSSEKEKPKGLRATFSPVLSNYYKSHRKACAFDLYFGSIAQKNASRKGHSRGADKINMNAS